MSYEIVYNKEFQRLESRMEGKLDPSELPAFGAKVVELLKKHGCRKVLNDMRGVEQQFSLIDIFSVPKRAVEVGYPEDTKRAVVFSDNRTDYLFLEKISASNNQNVKVFADIDEAQAWLEEGSKKSTEQVFKYYVDNRIQSGSLRTHVVHRMGCSDLPGEDNRLYVGHCLEDEEAMGIAAKMYESVVLCRVCCGNSAIDISPYVELIEDGNIIFVKCGCNHDLHEIEDLLVKVLTIAEEHSVYKVLCDYSEASTMPELKDLHELASKLPKQMHFAFVVQEDSSVANVVEFIAIVAGQHGLRSKVFSTTEEAIECLLA